MLCERVFRHTRKNGDLLLRQGPLDDPEGLSP